LAGWIADIAAHEGRLGPPWGEGPLLGAALALCAAVSPRPWLGALIAPPGALGALAVACVVQQARIGSPLPFLQALGLFLDSPGRAASLAFFAAGSVYAYARRMSNPAFTWRGPAFLLGVALAAWLLACAESSRPEAWLLRWTLGLALGGAAALEAALRLRRPPPPPSSL
jgi:hypothetical protein